MKLSERIRDFLAQHDLAILGVSRQGGKFGNTVFRELTVRGYRLMPVHPEAETLEGRPCYQSLRALPTQPGGALIILPPSQTESVVREADEAGIRRIWMQQGSASPEAIRYCEEHGISLVHGECILMYTEPVRSFHRFHRWVWRVLGKLAV